jgi:hypothetical protein
MRPQEQYDAIISDEVLSRNPSRFRELIGKDLPTGWRTTTEAERIGDLRKQHAGRYYRTRGPHA